MTWADDNTAVNFGYLSEHVDRLATNMNRVAIAIDTREPSRLALAVQIATGILAGNEACTAVEAGRKAVLTLRRIETELKPKGTKDDEVS